MELLKTIAVMSYMSLADYSLITRIRAFFFYNALESAVLFCKC